MAEISIPAIVAAGDGRAARAVCGDSKVYLEIAGRPLVARVVSVLQRVPEISEVWVVGNAERLAAVLGDASLQRELCKPLNVVPQRRNLLENCWQTYRRMLPGAGPAGRDPRPEEEDRPVLYLSADLPFATPQEISDFVRKGLAEDCDYACGLVPESAIVGFYPERRGQPGIRMAYFNLREGRFRQSNLHLVRPARLGQRQYIEEMYEHRYQKRLGNALALAWRLLVRRGGGLQVLLLYALMHLAGVADRLGMRRLADFLGHWISLEQVARGVSRLLDTRFHFVVTEVGGCAVDIDNERDFFAARARFEEFWRAQQQRAEDLLGRLPLAERAGPAAGLRVLPEGDSAEVA